MELSPRHPRGKSGNRKTSERLQGSKVHATEQLEAKMKWIYALIDTDRRIKDE
jgi:hypothetical protein